MTQNRNIYKKYCRSENQCQTIINEINIDGDFLEKYFELILRKRYLYIFITIEKYYYYSIVN